MPNLQSGQSALTFGPDNNYKIVINTKRQGDEEDKKEPEQSFFSKMKKTVAKRISVKNYDYSKDEGQDGVDGKEGKEEIDLKDDISLSDTASVKTVIQKGTGQQQQDNHSDNHQNKPHQISVVNDINLLDELYMDQHHVGMGPEVDLPTRGIAVGPSRDTDITVSTTQDEDIYQAMRPKPKKNLGLVGETCVLFLKILIIYKKKDY